MTTEWRVMFDLKNHNIPLRVVPVFLLGRSSALKSKDRAEIERETDEVLKRYGLRSRPKYLVKKEEELLKVRIKGVDGFVLFPLCAERFSPLIYLAETTLPIIIASEEENFSNALETYEYLADHKNVVVASGPDEVKRRVKALEASKWMKNAKVCLFDMEPWTLKGTAWNRNPLIRGKLNTKAIDPEKFFDAYEKADNTRAENLARKWMKESEVLEPSFRDVVKSARLYIAMKAAIEGMKADAGYVLWCGQFTKKLGTKMCYALAKLAEDGYPVGCWRGENLLPLLILHSAADKPIFVWEAFTHKGDIVTFRHCFVPSTTAPRKSVLRNWRDMEGTVTAYTELPRGEVTIVNCGLGDRLFVFKGEVVDCKDLGGDNCRMTIWVKMSSPESVRNFVGRECAMVYGDYVREAAEIGKILGLKVTS